MFGAKWCVSTSHSILTDTTGAVKVSATSVGLLWETNKTRDMSVAEDIKGVADFTARDTIDASSTTAERGSVGRAKELGHLSW